VFAPFFALTINCKTEKRQKVYKNKWLHNDEENVKILWYALKKMMKTMNNKPTSRAFQRAPFYINPGGFGLESITG
jgi:hypothetical protein